MEEIYITHGKRTAIGSFLGGLSRIPAPRLGAEVIKAVLQDSHIDPKYVDEVIFGQVLTGGSGQNPARQAAIYAGIPIEVPAITVNKVCGSSMQAVVFAANAIKSKQANLIIAGGQESMSLALHGLYLRAGNKYGEAKLMDLMMQDGLIDVFSQNAMGITAENLAEKFSISRTSQDQIACESHHKAYNAQKNGKFKQEIVPIAIHNTQTGTKETIEEVVHDEKIRPQINIQTIANLAPVFKKDGTVTVANSSPLSDGAACLIIASESALKTHKLTPIARIVSYASYGVDPALMGTGPVPASRLALQKAGWGVNDLDLIEVNEAFATQLECVNQQMKWDVQKVNVHGGAIALGHPLGTSGARIIVTLTNAMHTYSARKGLATLCIGGGMGIAMCVERV
jgi:acetyl-CoA C-acetyltransferase